MSVCKRQRLKHTGRGEYCEVRLYQAGNQLFVALHIPCSYDTWPSLCLYSLQHTGVQGQHRNTQPSFIPSSVVLNLPCQQSIPVHSTISLATIITKPICPHLTSLEISTSLELIVGIWIFGGRN